MIEWIALSLFILLILWSIRETFVDTEFKSSGVGVSTSVQRPPEDTQSPVYAMWKSKVDSQVPIGANDDDYIKAIRAFFDKVYDPSPTKPTTANIEAFLKSPDVVGLPLDTNALRMIIADGFHIEAGETAAAREKRQTKFTPTKNLEPSMGRDQVYDRTELEYTPADPRADGPVPEGHYAPLKQQGRPRRLGEANYETVGKTGTLFYDVCTESKREGCEENVL
jgi:hypothetical protein